jgi:hypothetical protein
MASVLTESQIESINTASTIISSTSLIGSTFIIACFLAYRHLRSFGFRLVFFLSITDVINQVFDLIQPAAADILAMEAGTQPVSATCYAQAAGDTYAELSSVLWTSAIAYTLFASVVRGVKMNETLALFWYIIVCCGVPTIMCVGAALDNAYGPAGGWCYMTDAKAYWRFVAFYAPLWICILFNTVVYFMVLRLLRNAVKVGHANDTSTNSIRLLMKRLQLYPFILVIVWLFASINRVYEWSSGGDQVYALYMLQRIFSCAQGSLNAFAYGYSQGVREALWTSMAKVFPCIRDDTSMAVLVRGQGGKKAVAKSVLDPAAALEGLPPVVSSPNPMNIPVLGTQPMAILGATGIPIPDDEDDLDVDVSIPASHLHSRPGESLRVNPGHMMLATSAAGGSSRLSANTHEYSPQYMDATRKQHLGRDIGRDNSLDGLLPSHRSSFHHTAMEMETPSMASSGSSLPPFSLNSTDGQAPVDVRDVRVKRMTDRQTKK